MNDSKRNDEAVSSVVGEMIMITLVIILVALFATSAFSLVPGGREASVDVVMKNVSGDITVVFWHKGGDWVEMKDLTVLVIRAEDGRREEYCPDVFDHEGSPVKAFDLGGCLIVQLGTGNPLECGDMVRLVTPKTVIYSGEIPKEKQP
mgnify:CR=1 FL=1